MAAPAAAAAAALNLEQRTSSLQFEYYRRGLQFNPNAANILALIAMRQLPHYNVVDAYNVVNNQALAVQRDAGVRANRFDIDDAAGPNIAARARRNNPNDMAQALTELQNLPGPGRFGFLLHPNRLTCQ